MNGSNCRWVLLASLVLCNGMIFESVYAEETALDLRGPSIQMAALLVERGLEELDDEDYEMKAGSLGYQKVYVLPEDSRMIFLFSFSANESADASKADLHGAIEHARNLVGVGSDFKGKIGPNPIHGTASQYFIRTARNRGDVTRQIAKHSVVVVESLGEKFTAALSSVDCPLSHLRAARKSLLDWRSGEMISSVLESRCPEAIE